MLQPECERVTIQLCLAENGIVWSCIGKACKDVLKQANVSKEQVKGIGFDATCSLAVCTAKGVPVSVAPGQHEAKEGSFNIILWADHRASEEGKTINAADSMVLKYVGGIVSHVHGLVLSFDALEQMSIEMEMPKMLWLKKHMPADLFEECMFFDLPDFLTYLATGSLARSNNSLVSKCSYVPPGVEDSKGWNEQFLTQIGLDSFVKNEYQQLGGQPDKGGLILTAGQPVGKGLSAKAAEELGLLEGTAVGSGVIDAYAGWIGTVAAPMEGDKDPDLIESRHRLAAIAGTSTCHIVQSPEAVFVPGVWGPYRDVVFPGFWINEGGQSSTGQLLDFMVETHPAFGRLKEMAEQQKKHHFVVLSDILSTLAQEQDAPFLSYLTRNLFLYPDLHGNRSPIADPNLRGVLIGLALDKTVNDLALKYLATCEAIALQTRHIVDTMNEKGHQITSIFMSGGLAKNPILMQLIADVCNMPVQLPASITASVVLGAAMLGAVAAEEQTLGPISTQGEAEKRSQGMKEKLWSTMVNMSKPGKTVSPKASEKERKLLRVKYNVFHESIALQRRIKKEVEEALA